MTSTTGRKCVCVFRPDPERFSLRRGDGCVPSIMGVSVDVLSKEGAQTLIYVSIERFTHIVAPCHVYATMLLAIERINARFRTNQGLPRLGLNCTIEPKPVCRISHESLPWDHIDYDCVLGGDVVYSSKLLHGASTQVPAPTANLTKAVIGSDGFFRNARSFWHTRRKKRRKRKKKKKKKRQWWRKGGTHPTPKKDVKNFDVQLLDSLYHEKILLERLAPYLKTKLGMEVWTCECAYCECNELVTWSTAEHLHPRYEMHDTPSVSWRQTRPVFEPCLPTCLCQMIYHFD